MKGARCNPKGNKGSLVLNKEEKKKEGQGSHTLRINGEMTINSVLHNSYFVVETFSKVLMGQVSRKSYLNPPSVRS